MSECRNASLFYSSKSIHRTCSYARETNNMQGFGFRGCCGYWLFALSLKQYEMGLFRSRTGCCCTKDVLYVFSFPGSPTSSVWTYPGGLGQIFSSSNQRLITAPLWLLSFAGFVVILEFGNDKWLPVLLAIMYSCVRIGQELVDTDNKCCVCVETEPDPSDNEIMLMDKSVLQRSVGMVESTQSPTA